jgi:hyperosmotically inducible protein
MDFREANWKKERFKDMRKGQLLRVILSLVMISVFTAAFAHDGLTARKSTEGDARSHIIKEVRHELAMLPYYGVFDWLEFEVRPDNSVVLRGQVVRPATKSEAESSVRNIDGVSKVINEIEVLPLSPEDDRLRVALYRTLYDWDSPLFRYATQSVPPIHIIVNHGRAVLKGVVATKADANLAYARARGVQGLFDVKNELQAESEQRR